MHPHWTTTHGEPIAWLLALASSITFDDCITPEREPQVLATVRVMLRHPDDQKLRVTTFVKMADTAIDAVHAIALEVAEDHALCECEHPRREHGRADGPWPCRVPGCGCAAFGWPRRAKPKPDVEALVGPCSPVPTVVITEREHICDFVAMLAAESDEQLAPEIIDRCKAFAWTNLEHGVRFLRYVAELAAQPRGAGHLTKLRINIALRRYEGVST